MVSSPVKAAGVRTAASTFDFTSTGTSGTGTRLPKLRVTADAAHSSTKPGSSYVGNAGAGASARPNSKRASPASTGGRIAGACAGKSSSAAASAIGSISRTAGSAAGISTPSTSSNKAASAWPTISKGSAVGFVSVVASAPSGEGVGKLDSSTWDGSASGTLLSVGRTTGLGALVTGLGSAAGSSGAREMAMASGGVSGSASGIIASAMNGSGAAEGGGAT